MRKHLKKQLIFVIPAIIAFTTIQGQNAPAKQVLGITISNMDLSVKPNEDFYRFVNGSWLKNTQIPSDKTRWGTYDELRQKTDIDALNILKEAAKNPKYLSNTDEGKAVNLYKSILDSVGRDKKGLSPLKPYLAKINAVKNVKDLQKLLVEMEPIGGIGFMGVGIDGDAKNSNRNVIYVAPGNVGLPDRDYYVSEDKDSKEKEKNTFCMWLECCSF